MYCPACGSNNAADVKFCTRCGTNLGVVFDALSGRPSAQAELDERMVRLFKEYYRGRNSVIVGTAATLIALFKMVLFALIGLPPRTDFLGTLAALLMVYGLVGIVWGIARWSNSTSEIKAIERATSRASFRAGDDRPHLLATEPDSIRSGVLSTDPIMSSASVTEQTTRQLDERRNAQPPAVRDQQQDR